MSPAAAKRNDRAFDPDTFLATIGEGRKILMVPKKQTIFAQGDEADAVFYIQKGKVRLTVVFKTGKEATIAILDDGIFLVKARWPVRFAAWDHPSRTRVFRYVRSLFAGTKYPVQRRSG
jgi:CRP-like cAMP-binding protein